MNPSGARCLIISVLGVLGATLAGCQPSTRVDPSAPPIAGSSAGVPPSDSSPRFAAGGPNADEYGVNLGYPIVGINRPQYARNDRHRLTAASMAKTVTAMLIGIAIEEGHIRSVNDPAAAYVPALAGTEYGRTSLLHLLQMSSGVRFNESYTGRDDVGRLWYETVLQAGEGGAAAVTPYNERQRWSGAVFSYSSAETQVLGLVLTNAVGRSMSEYLREKFWQPMGAEADATWIIDAAGQADSLPALANELDQMFAR